MEPAIWSLARCDGGSELNPSGQQPEAPGVVFKPTFTFSTHVAAIARKANRRLNVICAVADSRFGQDKERLTATFKGLLRPFFDYAAPIVYPNYCPTSSHRLQMVQNKALRLITGSHAAAARDHLHEETLILLVEQHLRLLAARHLVKSLQPTHPSHEQVASAPERGQCQKKGMLRSSCWGTVERFLTNGVVPLGELSTVLKSVHTMVVEETVSNIQLRQTHQVNKFSNFHFL